MIIDSGFRLNLCSYACDYETAIINAFSDEFVDGKHIGCYFHWKQALRWEGLAHCCFIVVVVIVIIAIVIIIVVIVIIVVVIIIIIIVNIIIVIVIIIASQEKVGGATSPSKHHFENYGGRRSHQLFASFAAGGHTNGHPLYPIADGRGISHHRYLTILSYTRV